MACKLSSGSGKTSTNEEFICQHMCNHYRRILNAKKVVDTSPPHSYKAKMQTKNSSLTSRIHKPKQNRNLSPAMTDRSLSTNSNKASSWGTESFISSSRYHTNCIPPDSSLGPYRKLGLVDMNLINQITYDTKNGPAAYCDEKWRGMKAQDAGKKHNVAFDVSTDKRKTATPTAKQSVLVKGSNESNEKAIFQTQRKSSKGMSKQRQSLASFGPKRHPRITKTETVSKLRSLRVYYPPRRKKKRENENPWSVSDERALHMTRSKDLEICINSPKQNDFKKPIGTAKEQTSSRDSAYNGGVSSLPESGSLTPDHRSKTELVCGAQEGIQNKTIEICKYFKEGEFTSSDNVTHPGFSSRESKHEEEEALKKMKDDALYVKFIQDITVEVLEKGLFTNKGIKKVMRKHIINNLQVLDKGRMVKEVENLRIQLGVPEDKCLLEIEGNNEDGSGSIFKAYPVISDSAFTLPENLKESQTDPQRMSNSISRLLQGNEETEFGSNSDEDVISVIQVAKKLRERMPSADSEEGSGNRKKRPKVSKFPKTRPGFPETFFSSSSSSSSWENEETSEAFARKSENQAGKKSWECSCMCDVKKNRSVTFDSNDELRQPDGKCIDPVACGNDLQKNDRKMKAKND